MNEFISPKYLMQLANEVEKAIIIEFTSIIEAEYYIRKWLSGDENDFYNQPNFYVLRNEFDYIDLLGTLRAMEGNTLLKNAVDLGVETPDFIPSIASFRNEIKSDYKTASATFEEAFKQIETHPDIAIGLANSALESIIKEIFKDVRIETKPKPGKTLYDLTRELLKELQLFPNSEMPTEIKAIGSSLLAANQNIEKLRSEKTNAHGKTSDEYIIEDPLYTYFIINTVTTVGLFLKSYYKNKFPSTSTSVASMDDLPF